MATYQKKKKKPQVAVTEDMITLRNTATQQTFPISRAVWESKKDEWGRTFEVVREKGVKEPEEVTELKKKRARKKVEKQEAQVQEPQVNEQVSGDNNSSENQGE